MKKQKKRLIQIREYAGIRISRFRYGVIDPEYAIRELHVFERSKPGDVVFCEMPFSDFNLAAIPKGHRCRPYLLIEKQKNGIIAAPCSHQMYRNYPRWQQIALKPADGSARFLFFGDIRYSKKNSYCCLGSVFYIRSEKMLSKSRQACQEDLMLANRILRVLDGRKKRRKRLQIQGYADGLRAGDIVLNNKKEYLITECSSLKASGYLLQEKCPENDAIRIECFPNLERWISEGTPASLEHPEMLDVISFCSTEKLLEAEKEIRLLKKKMKEEAKQKEREAAKRAAARNVPEVCKSLRLKYPTGAVFRDFASGYEFVYLWSRRRTDYYLDLEMYYDGKTVFCHPAACMLEEEQECIDEQTYFDCLDGFFERDKISSLEKNWLSKQFLEGSCAITSDESENGEEEPCLSEAREQMTDGARSHCLLPDAQTAAEPEGSGTASSKDVFDAACPVPLSTIDARC